MKHVALCIAVALAGGCVTEEEPAVGTAEADLEVLVDEPAPAAWCGGCGPEHIVGDPVRIYTSYYGYCRSFGLEYPCRPQQYALTIECSNGPCVATPAGGSTDGWIRYTDVVVDDPAPVTIRARINSTTFNLPPVTSLVPDEVRVSCGAGWSFTDPCVGEIGQPGAMLTYQVWSGGHQLAPRGRFEIEDDIPSLQQGEHGERWYAFTPGTHHIRATYATATLEHELTIAPPPPVPPPPPPPVPRTVGRTPMAGGEVLQ